MPSIADQKDVLEHMPDAPKRFALFGALLVRSGRPRPTSQMPIEQIAEAQSAWWLKHIWGRHDGPISEGFNRAEDGFR